ncbi:hypothetical protein PRIPAC_74075 [Pristionchus pacificus]|uniref:Serpentine receptor class gamma n=1 Tax=Pristionchus pacificus TaxID=54126 RepID=A0A2A6C8B4_PRIPA|nr:hypothetical protein PRIPAC_74075 [Pristionchus pacificus]|eukprot:PDM74293.1 G protein-coupled receptor [Pristionchus pacificus]
MASTLLVSGSIGLGQSLLPFMWISVFILRQSVLRLINSQTCKLSERSKRLQRKLVQVENKQFTDGNSARDPLLNRPLTLVYLLLRSIYRSARSQLSRFLLLRKFLFRFFVPFSTIRNTEIFRIQLIQLHCAVAPVVIVYYVPNYRRAIFSFAGISNTSKEEMTTVMEVARRADIVQKVSTIEYLHSSFFNFFILAGSFIKNTCEETIMTGIASCFNIYLIVLKGLVERFATHSAFRDLVFNIIIFGSHSFSLTHTMGKVLTFYSQIFWTPLRTKLVSVLLFIFPALLHSFMIPLEAVHRLNSEGVMRYVGVELWAQQQNHLLYFLYDIHYLFCSDKQLVKQEWTLLVYTICITFAHLVKSAQQIFWFVTIVIDNAPLFDLAAKMYNVGNTLTTFVPPILLLVMSPTVRHEIIDVLMDKAVSIYYSIFEPVLTVAYAWILLTISRSRANELRSSFFKFFVVAGIASSMNIIMVHLQEYGRFFLEGFSLKDLCFNLMVFGSHSFSMSHTIGKTLVIASRFTAICYPLSTRFWTRSRINLSIFIMFCGPALLTTATGEKVYVGVEVWAQEVLSKVIAFTSYLAYIGISVPMCVASLYKLRLAQRFNIDLARQERSLLFYSVIITLAHLVKSGQQIFWYITVVLKRPDLYEIARQLYLISNAFTTFVPPLLLLFTSSVVRNEVTLGCLGRGRYSASILPYFSSTNTQTTNIPSIASCLNILMIDLQRIANYFLPENVKSRDIIFNVIVFCSHSFSLSHTLGKVTIVIATRFTAICYPLKTFWRPFLVRASAFLMFIIPAILYSFMIPLTAAYRRDQEGRLMYVGVEEWAQELSKLISATSYIIFIGVSFPMCAASIYYLRKAQLFNQDALVKQERALLIYTIVIAAIHLIKSAQQILWFVAMVRKDIPLFYVATALYNHINAITTFVPPILLIFSSRLVRHEMTCPCISRRLRYNMAIAHSSSFGFSGSSKENTPALPQ